MTQTFTCPVCSFDKMPWPPEDYNICHQCGTEFGNDDAEHTHAELRKAWVDAGSKFWYEEVP